MDEDQSPERATRAARVKAAARTAAAAFGPNYRRAREEARGFGVVLLTRVIAWISIAGVALYTVSTVVSDLTSRSISLRLPVYEFWPTLPAGATIISGPTAEVTGGGFTSAEVYVSGLDTAARAWLAGSSLLQGATIIMIAIVVVTLSSTILRPRHPTGRHHGHRGRARLAGLLRRGRVARIQAGAAVGLDGAQGLSRLGQHQYDHRIPAADAPHTGRLLADRGGPGDARSCGRIPGGGAPAA
jgi:hypothetical protein